MRSARTSTAWTFAGSSLAQLDLRGYGRFDVNHIAAPDVRCGWGQPERRGAWQWLFPCQVPHLPRNQMFVRCVIAGGLSGCSNFISCAGYWVPSRTASARACAKRQQAQVACMRSLGRRASNTPLTTRSALSRRACVADRPSCPSPIRSDWRCWSSFTNWKNSQCWIDSGVSPTYWGCASYRR